MSSSHLDLSERYRLHALHETGMSMRAIAHALERAPSTISRELRRNRHAAQYLPDHVQRINAHRRTQASRRPRIDAARIGQIQVLLGEDFSPEQITGRTGLASHAWIYRHIYADQKRGGQLFMHLRKRRRNRTIQLTCCTCKLRPPRTVTPVNLGKGMNRQYATRW